MSLTGEYDLDDEYKVIYNYNKMMKNVKLEKVEGKNQWNLTMYAGTTVVLPYAAAATVDKLEFTSAKSEYVDGYTSGAYINVNAWAPHSKKPLKNNVLTVKAYSEEGKCLSTLEIVVMVLPYNAKLERTKLVTAEELYKLEYRKEVYSNFAWERIVKNYPEVLLSGEGSPLYVYKDHVSYLDLYDHKMPQYLVEQFGSKDTDELYNILSDIDPAEVWNYDGDLVGSACYAAVPTPDKSYRSMFTPTEEEILRLQKILDSLYLEQYETDWEKVLEIQKWVKANIKYKKVGSSSIAVALDNGYAQCAGFANLMCTACRLIDILCYVVIGSFISPNDHVWNIVLVDGLWCSMDMVESYVGFNGIADTGDVFKGKPNLAAYESLQPALGGICLDETNLYWSCVTNSWKEE